MKIGIDATIHYTSKPTGLGIYTAHLVNAISRLHDDLIVWTASESLLDLRPEQTRNVMNSLRFAGKNLFYLRPFWINMFLPRLAREEGVDAVLTTVPSAMVNSPVPHVIIVQDVIPVACPGEAPRLVTWNYRYLLPKVFSHAASIIAISEYTKRDIQKYYQVPAEKIHSVPCGYDADVFSPGTEHKSVLERYGIQSKGYLLVVGDSSHRKNHERVLRAFQRIHDKVPFSLVFAGIKNKQNISREIQRLELNDRVRIFDYIRHADLPHLYRGAAAFLYLSLYEGFGLPVLEAMACGTPVIASATTSIPEVAGQAAILVDPLDEAAVAGSILKIANDPENTRQLVRTGLDRCRAFSWEKAGQQVLSVMKAQARKQTLPGVLL